MEQSMADLKAAMDLMLNTPEPAILIQSFDAASSIPDRTHWGVGTGARAAHEVVSDRDTVPRDSRSTRTCTKDDDELEKDSQLVAVAP